ncbi:mitochondrial ATP synthase epsilon chain-domain-containing protein [Flagelloscypha sp. PMI_526]|nr:mitochondrial ATP synthase epsilon chain-domain-containing protein [Flagelloscypha sp. PMI_526]KAH8824793.1 mitochondrial ATP synthase epsilon chain-domain-containing protein [Flagelloscypha sp. PMI_526]
MSSATWRSVFRSVLFLCHDFLSEVFYSYNKFATITARALRASLKEDMRVAAEKRGLTSLRYQKWENGVGGEQVLLKPEATK